MVFHFLFCKRNYECCKERFFFSFQLKSILPDSFKIIISEYIQGDKPENFHCTLRLPIFSKEGALKWLKDFEERSFTTWKVERTHKENTQKIIFKVSVLNNCFYF